MTNMERFIRENREKFDDREPSPLLWDKIEAGMQKKNPPARVFKLNVFKWSAAAVLFAAILGTALFFFNQKEQVNNTEITAGKVDTEDPLVENIDPEYGQMVAQFSNMIERKQKQLRTIEKDNPELYRKFAGDIRKLDSTYQVLRNTLPANPNKEQLLQAMISNLQMQIDLLNQQLTIIQKVKQPVKEKI